MLGIKSLAHTAFYVQDMDGMLDFYCGKLGLRKAFESADQNGRPWLVYVEIAPGQFIEFFHGGAAPVKNEKPAGFVHMCLSVEDIEACAQALRDKGVTLDDEPRIGKSGCWLFFVTDPEGNSIEFMQILPDSMQAVHGTKA